MGKMPMPRECRCLACEAGQIRHRKAATPRGPGLPVSCLTFPAGQGTTASDSWSESHGGRAGDRRFEEATCGSGIHPRPAEATGGPKSPDWLREALRARHSSRRTEPTYCHWVERFICIHPRRVLQATYVVLFKELMCVLGWARYAAILRPICVMKKSYKHCWRKRT
jgi:hypothetical protein